MTQKQQQRTPSQDELITALNKHLFYEIVRLVEQYKLLNDPMPYRSGLKPDVATPVDDALIVSFCTHARNILEFLFRADRTQYNYLLATDYAKTGYKRLEKKGRVQTLYGELCAKINHLTLDRTDKDDEKIGPKVRQELVELIHEEIARLEHDLEAGFDKGYLAVNHLVEAKGLKVGAGAIGATNEIITSSSKPTQLEQMIGG